MIYIDFYCDKSDLDRWRQWCAENDIDEEDECQTGYIERGAGVMDFYFRLLCIAAYGRISNSSQVRSSSLSTWRTWYPTMDAHLLDSCILVQ